MDEPKEVVRKKNNTWQIVCITLIVGLLIGIAGAYLFFSKNPKLITKTSVSTDVKEQEEVNEKNVLKTYKATSIFIKKLIEKYDHYYISNTEVFDNFYSKEETKVTDLDANLIKILSAKEANRRLNTAYFTEEEFQDAKTMLFGNNIVVENGDFYLDGCGTAIKYYTESKTYSYYSEPSGGCGGASGSSMIREITKVENKDDTLEVTVVAAIHDGTNNKIYADTKFTQEITDVKISSDYTIAEADYDKLPKFTYYFSYDEENNNYYLTTIKKVNE